MNVKGILTSLGIVALFGAIYLAREAYNFADGVKQEAARLKNYTYPDTIQLDSLTFIITEAKNQDLPLTNTPKR